MEPPPGSRAGDGASVREDGALPRSATRGGRPRRLARTAALRRAEIVLLVAGAVLLAFAGGAKLAGETARQRDLERFDAAVRAAADAGDGTEGAGRPDTELWSPERIKAWEESRRSDLGVPLAVVRIPKVGIEVPVFEGTGELVLNRAAGLIEGTVRPGEPGNSGIAAHRDGYFRGLKDVVPGDAVEVRTLAGTREFVVESIRIVGPEEVSVLDPTAEPVLTLVTCYPFYFVGSAPQRWVVRAVRRAPGHV